MRAIIDWRSVLIGGALAGGIAVVLGLSLGMMSDTSNLGFVVFALIMTGMAAGGFVGARTQPDIAFTAGAAAAFLGSLAAQSLSVLVNLARGTDFPTGYLFGAIFTLMISTSFGVVGGYAALRRERRTDSPSEEAPT